MTALAVSSDSSIAAVENAAALSGFACLFSTARRTSFTA